MVQNQPHSLHVAQMDHQIHHDAHNDDNFQSQDGDAAEDSSHHLSDGGRIIQRMYCQHS